MVTPDGMPLVWVSRLLGRARTKRVYGPDLMRAMTALSARRGYRQFYYGGAPGVAENLRRTLTTLHPALQVAGTLCPPFRPLTPEEDRDAVGAINAARPDILWIGLSTPRQEVWMADHLGRIDAPVMIGVGAAFDFLAGTKKQASVWVQRNGLEWLFRLSSEPRRLWRRYAWVVPGFAVLATGAVLRQAITSRNVWPRLASASLSIRSWGWRTRPSSEALPSSRPLRSGVAQDIAGRIRPWRRVRRP
jgi:N-acetylglucosaminyldiphosphoundecaprenol N-acetyl-beta-D-mannosaminyltransferase